MAIRRPNFPFVPSDYQAKGIQWSFDARRAAILLKRAAAGNLIGAEAPDTRDQTSLDIERANLIFKREGTRGSEWGPDTQPSHTSIAPTPKQLGGGTPIVEDYVSLIDVDADGLDKGYEEIKFHCIPKELQWNSESTFAAIKPIGRNNAFYHYTGAEDKLEFEIDWFSSTWDRQEVIRKCRIVESLTKSDGYKSPPHRVLLNWSGSGALFNEIYFIVIAAPYRMTQFIKSQPDRAGGFERTHMMPTQAYQKITLARITEANLTREEIRRVHTG